MKKLLGLLAVSTLVSTSASSLNPLFINSVVGNGFKANQVNNKDINIQGENNTNPFIRKININGFPTSNITTMAIAPDGTIYAAASWKGLYKSTDGINFIKVSGIPDDSLIHSISITKKRWQSDIFIDG